MSQVGQERAESIIKSFLTTLDMLRIKTQIIKRTGKKLYNSNKDKFTGDFDKNKPIVQNLLHNPNKKLKNIVTGYITHLVKQNKF